MTAGGNANARGGGVYATAANVTVTQSLIAENYIRSIGIINGGTSNPSGGGMYLDSSSTLRATQCIFRDNRIFGNHTGGGGAFYMEGTCTSYFWDCAFTGK
jgi:hypothetical protein